MRSRARESEAMVELVKGGKYAWFVLTILGAIYVQNQWSRYSLNYMYAVSADDDKESIRAATDLNAADYGILTGYGFAGTFCVAGLVAGRLADIWVRKYIIFLGVLIWNAGMFGIGVSTTFWQLLVFRLVLGAGQAFTNPASYALIADYFPEDKRAEANGLFACGVYIGGGVASLCLEMAESWGWRRSCYLIALVGFALAMACLLFVREPPRAGKAAPAAAAADALDKPAAATPTLRDSLREIFGNNVICVLFVASSFRFMGGYAIATYLPTFYSTIYPDKTSQYSIINCTVVALGGFLSSWGGGKVSDMWLKVEPKARLYLPAAGCLLGVPFFCVCVLVPNFYVSIIGGLFLEYLVAECWFGPIIAVVQSQLSPTSRAQAISWFTLIANFWSSAYVALLGWVYDKLLSAGYAASCVRYLVLFATVVPYCIAAALFLFTASIVSTDASDAPAREPLLKSSAQQNADPEKANAVGQPPMLTKA